MEEKYSMDNTYINFSKAMTFFLAASVGIIVASMFYIQPIEAILTKNLHVSPSKIALIAMLTQVSYALGLLFIVPLGDIYNRYHFLQWTEATSIVGLMLAAFSHNYLLFGLASIIIGLTSVGGQIIIPYVAYLTPVSKQGPILGAMISGMLTGILFARTFSGFIATIWGWQSVYLIAAGINLILLIMIHLLVPDDPRNNIQVKSYCQIIGSLPYLIKKYKFLRGSAINGFCLFGLANLFWATLAFLLADQFNLSSAVAGSMGLLGIVAIFVAPIIGRMVDRYSPQLNIKISWFLAAFAYLIFAIFIGNMIALIIGVIILDLSTQFSQVTNQAIIQSLNREENSRNNSIFMFSYFFGGSIGTIVGINMWSMYKWTGVTIAASVFLLIALINYFWQGVPKFL